VDLTAFFTVGRVNSGLGRRQRKDEPAAAGIDGAKAQNIAKERAVGLRVVAVEENMRACDARNHRASLTSTSLTSKRIPSKECFDMDWDHQLSSQQ